MIQITEAAVGQLKILLAEKPEAVSGGLRIAVGKGGCAGLQYEMTLDEIRPGDAIAESGGVRVLVDPASADFLAGSTVDYRDELAGEGFRILNPNAARSCGCGTSFEPADAAEAAEAAALA